MEGFTRDRITVKVRLLTTHCEACGKTKEVEYLPAELASLQSGTPTYREAEKRRAAWEEFHAQECRRVPALLTA